MPASRSRRDVRSLLLPGLAFLLAVVAAVAVFAGGDEPVLVDAGSPTADVEEPATTASGATTADDAPSVARMQPLQLPEDSPMAVGAADAPMVMVTFESFGCLWCGHMHTRTMPAVMQQYVDEGLLRIEARMLPYEPAAAPGARIGAAAGLQDRYWELAEHLYAYIAGGGEPPVGRELTDREMGAYRERQTEESLLAEVERVADEVDLDWERFVQDYRSEEAEAIVTRDTLLGTRLGFTGTPGMVINGVPVGGYRSEATFLELLDAVLDASTTAG